VVRCRLRASGVVAEPAVKRARQADAAARTVTGHSRPPYAPIHVVSAGDMIVCEVGQPESYAPPIFPRPRAAPAEAARTRSPTRPTGEAAAPRAPSRPSSASHPRAVRSRRTLTLGPTTGRATAPKKARWCRTAGPGGQAQGEPAKTGRQVALQADLVGVHGQWEDVTSGWLSTPRSAERGMTSGTNVTCRACEIDSGQRPRHPRGVAAFTNNGPRVRRRRARAPTAPESGRRKQTRRARATGSWRVTPRGRPRVPVPVTGRGAWLASATRSPTDASSAGQACARLSSTP